MKSLSHYIFSFLFIFTLATCNGQVNNSTTNKKYDRTKLVGGPCDGCELMFVGMPENISPIDTGKGWHGEGQKLLITGTVYEIDGKTPARDVIVYYWQTDHKGYYTPEEGMPEKAKRHGRLRGWIKTGDDGKYSIYTIRPAPYPDNSMPAHIHTSIKEPNIPNEYYIDEFVFDDDKLLLESFKKYPPAKRGGSGVLRVVLSGDLQIAEHNIILGLNVPNYPKQIKSEKQSGLNIGEDHPSFIPFHAWGPDKGTRTCPVCKYGRYHGIVFYVGNHPNWKDIKEWLHFLEKESIVRSKYLKAYFVYGNDKLYNKEKRQKELEELGKALNLQKTALTFVPSFADTESEVNLNKINPEVDNTILIYRHRTIVDKYINLAPTASHFKQVSASLDRTQSQYFSLPEPAHN